MTTKADRISHLTTLEMQELDEACRPIHHAFGGPPYLVGSAVDGGGFRDVDVRLILGDEEFDALFGERLPLWSFLCRAISTYLRDRTRLPVDFQIQRMTEANSQHGQKERNPLGMGRTFAGRGDATPFTAEPERVA